MQTVDFLNTIIDDYSDVAFHTCIHYLYQFFDFKFLTIHNIRKVDAKDGLYRLYEKNWKKDETISNYFGIAVKYYIADVFKYVSGSRAEKYKQKAISIADDLINNKTDSIGSMEDLAIIYFSLLREYIKNPDEPISDLDLSVDNTDLDILEDWRTSKIYGPETKEELYSGNQRFGQIKVPMPKKRIVPIPQSNKRKNKVFRVSCILLCRMLDKAGVFTDLEGID